MQRYAVSKRRTPKGTQREIEMTRTLQAIAGFFQRLFVRKHDDFKALLIADLGIER